MISPVRTPTHTSPFASSFQVNIPAILQTPTIMRRETETPRIRPPTLSACCSYPIFVNPTRIATNIANAPAKAAPFIISSLDSMPANLQTPTIRAIANAILVTMEPTFAMSLSAPLATAVIDITKIANAAENRTPLPISSGESNPIILQTPTIRSMANDNLIIIPPMPLTSFEYLEIPPMAAKNTSIPEAIAARLIIPLFA